MLTLCPKCNTHHKQSDINCPNCNTSKPRLGLAPMLLLGLGLAACGQKDADTADTAEDTATAPIEPADAPEYGVEAVENPDEDLILDFEEFDKNAEKIITK